MDALARFAELLREADPPLDEACLLIAAQLRPGIDVASELARIDDLAAGVRSSTIDGLRDHLFGHHGFRGDVSSYRDPANSLLPQVVDRRRGIPITLSILTIAVGRRRDIPLVGIGLPGHFLVGDTTQTDWFLDPFHLGIMLNRAGCERLLRRIHGSEAVFHDAYLQPTPPAAIMARVLQNLRVSYLGAKDRAHLVEVLRLRGAVPGTTTAERLDVADALARTGRFDLAALELEVAAEGTPGPGGDQLRARAIHLRARLN